MILRPNLYINHYRDIDLNHLLTKGIKGLILDVDNTLVPYFVDKPTSEAISFINKCLSLGFKVVIISNNDKARVSKFCDGLNVPFYWFALKPFSFTYKKAMKELGFNNHQIAVVGDQLLTDVIGGNKMGFYTILQKPLVEKDLIYTKINRKIEKIIINKMKLEKGESYE